METLSTADGQAIDLDEAEQQFAAAMAAPRSDEPEAPAPPKREPTDPDAPYGRKVDGTPKKAPGGRPPKPRMIEGPKDGGKAKGNDQPPSGRDYTAPLMEFCEGLYMIGASVPIPHDPTRVRVRVQAHVIRSNAPGIAQSVNTMAQHNGTIRAGVEKLTMGTAGWVLPAVMALAPFAFQSAALWRAPIEGDMRDIADQIDADWKETVEAMKAEFAAEAQAAQEASEQEAA